jgi:aryl-alcohol dehydrogenase-like predicted oxidoreductase
MQGFYPTRFKDKCHSSFFRELESMTFSEIGIGTFGGEAKNIVDDKIVRSCVDAVKNGINVIDTSPAYRYHRSEKAVGRALKLLDADSLRQETILISKAGIITSDSPRVSTAEHVEQDLLPAGVQPGQMLGTVYSISPAYLDFSLQRSLKHLGRERLDLFLLESVEVIAERVSEENLLLLLEQAFSFLEQCVETGTIRSYGISSHSGFTLAAGEKGHLPLDRILQCARNCGGNSHHFRFLQTPLSLGDLRPLNTLTATTDGTLTLPETAASYDLHFLAYMPLAQGQLVDDLPPEIAECFPECVTDSLRAIQFVRSAPGVRHVTVGMRNRSHLDENLQLRSITPATIDSWRKLFTDEEAT